VRSASGGGLSPAQIGRGRRAGAGEDCVDGCAELGISVGDHAVDVQDLRPLRGRPCGPILDPDAYPGAHNSRTRRSITRNTGVDRPRPYRDDLSRLGVFA